jgi:hypothetical protein
MSERETVLAKASFDVMERYVDRNGNVDVFRMCDRIAELEDEKRNNVACVKWIAAAFCDEFGNPRGDMPQWAHAVTDTLLLGVTPADAVIRSLTPAPRVVVTDEWQLISKSGAVSEVGITSAADAEEARVYHDATWPADAPHRVVRVALVSEEALTEAPADGA